MIWKKITIETSTEAEDLISMFLDECGVEGVMIEDNVPLTDEELKEMFVDVPLQKEDDGVAKISCFIPPDRDVNELITSIKEELNRLEEFLPVGSKLVGISDTSDDSEWQNNWKQYYKPIRLNDDIVIVPAWEDYKDVRENDIIIKIESVMAFGTGSHETTKLCIDRLKAYMKPGSSVFDVGCGSGILSIVASKLGAGYVHGLDIDPQAIISSEENAKANDLGKDAIEFSCGNLLAGNVIGENAIKAEKASLCSGIAAKSPAEMVDIELGEKDSVPAREYDIVVANILADVIIPMSGVIKPYLKVDGIFITSGISDTREEDVVNAMIENDLEIMDILRMNEWVSIVARKKKNA